jgi:hypothetical protein
MTGFMSEIWISCDKAFNGHETAVFPDDRIEISYCYLSKKDQTYCTRISGHAPTYVTI